LSSALQASTLELHCKKLLEALEGDDHSLVWEKLVALLKHSKDVKKDLAEISNATYDYKEINENCTQNMLNYVRKKNKNYFLKKKLSEGVGNRRNRD
jgi:hypothetical protein